MNMARGAPWGITRASDPAAVDADGLAGEVEGCFSKKKDELGSSTTILPSQIMMVLAVPRSIAISLLRENQFIEVIYDLTIYYLRFDDLRFLLCYLVMTI